MKIVSCYRGFRVVDVSTQKTLYKSFSRIDCEQWVFGMDMKRKGVR